jgi:hypothetical protein
MMNPRELPASVVLLCAVALMACGRGESEPAPARSAADGVGGVPSFFPSDALRLEGPGDLVLVEGNHGIELTLAEYNGRVREDRLPAGMDTTDARERYLQTLVDYKVAAVEARLRGYVPEKASNTIAEERDLAGQILQESIMAAASISDDQAQQFVRDHPEEFPGFADAVVTDPGSLQHVKYTMQNGRLRTQLEGWKDREQIVVHVDRIGSQWPRVEQSKRTAKETGP